MDYHRHYDALIARARARVLEGYSERHHVVPTCIGGGDDAANKVRLTPEEHFVAHQLLVKMHPGEHLLTYALMSMTRSNRYHQRIHNKLFGWIKRKLAEAYKARVVSAETRAKLSAASRDPVLRAKIRAALRSPSARAKMSVIKTGVRCSEATKAKLRSAILGYKHDPEVGRKRGAARRGKKLPIGTGAKIAAKLLGRSMPQETRDKISAARKGMVFSAQHRERISLGRLALYKARRELKVGAHSDLPRLDFECIDARDT